MVSQNQNFFRLIWEVEVADAAVPVAENPRKLGLPNPRNLASSGNSKNSTGIRYTTVSDPKNKIKPSSKRNKHLSLDVIIFWYCVVSKQWELSKVSMDKWLKTPVVLVANFEASINWLLYKKVVENFLKSKCWSWIHKNQAILLELKT